MLIYLTGASGFVGGNFLRVALAKGHSIFAPLNKNLLVERPGLQTEVINLLDRQTVTQSLRVLKPDVIVHMAFFNDLVQAYQQRQAAWQVMVNATEHLLDAAEAWQIPFVFISTDWVFDGTQGPSDETTPPNPINYYGVLKLVGETLTRHYSKGAVARLSGVFGPHWEQEDWKALQNTGFGHLPVAVIESLKQGRVFELWTEGDALNQLATPTLASDACEMMLKIIDQKATGVFHCCGAEGLSREELAHRTAAHFGLDSSLIHRSSINTQQPQGWQGIPIPADTRLNAKQSAQILGHTCLTLEESLQQLKEQLEMSKA